MSKAALPSHYGSCAECLSQMYDLAQISETLDGEFLFCAQCSAKITSFSLLPYQPSFTSTVYFIQAGEYVKIGKTDDIRKRVAQLQTGCPHEIRVILLVPGNEREEKISHRELSSERVRGEWFRLSEKTVAHVVDVSWEAKTAMWTKPSELGFPGYDAREYGYEDPSST